MHAVVMTSRLLLALLLLGQWQAVAFGQDDVEKAETGQAQLDDGRTVNYRIRLMPLNAFPQLPRAVVKTLEQRGCLIPQTYEARQPENVIHGSFEKKGSSDWALLCSSGGNTALLVFFASHPGVAMVIRKQSDAEWLGSEEAGKFGSGWGISTAPSAQVSASQGRGAPDADHDGIADIHLERFSTVRYFDDGKWSVVDGSGS